MGLESDVTTRVSVEDEVLGVLKDRGFPQTRVHELRWGRLVLVAPPREAALLRMDQDVVLERLSATSAGLVETLVVRTSGPAA